MIVLARSLETYRNLARRLGSRIQKGTVADLHHARVIHIQPVRHTVDQLAAGNVDSLTIIDFQERRTRRLALFCFVMEGATLNQYVGRCLQLNAGEHSRRMTSEGIAGQIDLAGVFDQYVSISARVDTITGEGNAVATGEVDIVFLRADDVT